MTVLAADRRQAASWLTHRALPMVVVATAGAAAFYWDGLASLVTGWSRPEYSYGPLVPFITAYLMLLDIAHHPNPPVSDGRKLGIAVFGLALLVGLLGNLAQIPDITTYGFILFVGSMILLVAGTTRGLRFWPGWLHLIFMLPLPQFIYLHVSTNLQLISSGIGVWLIQLFQIPVFLDGNIIDLGIYKLQVAEACSGLRYLFPLFSFGWLFAVLYQGPAWHRVILFLSVVPITVLMNSFRIGVIGILVDRFGIEQAEGFLHYFEGWVIFLVCVAVLYSLSVILCRFFSFGAKQPARVLDVAVAEVLPPLKQIPQVAGNRVLAITAILALTVGIAFQFSPQPATAQITRPSFVLFPLDLGEWHGQSTTLDPSTAAVLGATDYFVANFRDQGRSEVVNVLLTFYDSQVGGSGIHSPEVCLPTGGWEVARWEQVQTGVTYPGQTAPWFVNRAIIQKGLDRQLVYYWFEQRGQRTTNDFEGKLMSVKDSILTGRSDGGLVRLVTPIYDGETVEQSERRLNGFLERMLPQLSRYYPGYDV